MCKRKGLSSILALLVASTACAGASRQIKEETFAEIPIKVIHESRSSFGTQFVETVIADGLYSRENLEAIWRHYCEKYADKKIRLM